MNGIFICLSYNVQCVKVCVGKHIDWNRLTVLMIVIHVHNLRSMYTKSLIFSLFLSIARSQKNDKSVHPQIKFAKDYDARLMPSIHNLPLHVNLTVNVKNIYDLSEIEQLLKMESTLQLNWVDERVQLKNDTSYEFWTLPPSVSLLNTFSLTCYILQFYSIMKGNKDILIYIYQTYCTNILYIGCRMVLGSWCVYWPVKTNWCSKLLQETSVY